ncbi:acyltransferase [Enterococcus sp. DIV0876]|uniref:acyltransferase n=1 Tax=Enterococcus sp. DIV0876 TaxID=2774633 RepID=UPI003D30020E
MMRTLRKIISIFQSPEIFARKQGVTVGNGCSIMTKNFGSEPYLINIGDNVQVTKGVSFFTHGGAWLLRMENPNFDFFGKIVIKNNVYIGNNTLLMPGITIEDNVIVGAGSVVTKSVPTGKIVAGNPAKIIGEYSDYKSRMDKYNLNTKIMNFDEKKKFLLSLDESNFISKKFM